MGGGWDNRSFTPTKRGGGMLEFGGGGMPKQFLGSFNAGALSFSLTDGGRNNFPP